ncbi:LPS assembly protein LptD [Sulfurimonas aquatica]|uniref:LPS assembly protein LptD n=1 Tax=Sulfurimonas aquatica TaxID=2672570 RepID=A0A975GBU2_9BACT|nr:LPS assembly protein LptD [Sulfurimonas aquatica]QSZ41046.1 LPS assembly protein LptD [Sulfurimonas aquatica]
MLKILVIFILVALRINASDKVEIYAATIESYDNYIEATGGVTVVYKDYFLVANRAKYNRESGDLELFDKIRLNQGGEYKLLGKYAKLNIEKKEKFFEPFYMSEIKSKVWISAGEGKSTADNIEINSGSISGCDPVNPLWKLEFSSSDYDSESKWMNIYNARLYIYDIPVLYTPYFGYSLDTKRRSGLLMPSLGYSGEEGFFYEQPLYIAEQSWWDLEIKPQLRSQRGQGIYQTFRFVDSKYSHGEFEAGYFKESGEYFESSNLKNNSHYGFKFNYDNNDFINQWFGLSLEGQTGLYVDAHSMNDVDYINLASNDTFNNSTATQLLSRANMFYNSDKNYIGSYFKYYQDLTLTSNDATLQKLPTIQYHRYLDTFLKDHLLYSLDVQTNNIERLVNKKVIQTDISLPIVLRTTLFDEYLDLSYKANAYMQYSRFSGTEDSAVTNFLYRDGYLLRNYHTLSASSQLTRKYEEYSHVVGFGLSYNKSGTESKNGYYSDTSVFCADQLNKEAPECEFYNISDVQDETLIDFTQYVYNQSAEQVLYHRMAQKISFLNNKDQFGELENELDYKFSSSFSYYNNMFFNYEKGLFSKVFNQIAFKKYGLDTAFSHLYKDTFNDTSLINNRHTSYLTSSLSYTYNNHYSFSGRYNYDLQTRDTKSIEAGFMYKKRCWDFGIKYSENNRPILIASGESSIYDKYIYLTIVLKPLMQSDGSSFLTYQLPNKD